MNRIAVAIPLAPKSKRPLVKWGGDVTTDKGSVVPHEWKDKFTKGCNVALRTDGLVVVDCDNEQTVRLWESNPANETPIAVKTSRGKHFYYRRLADSDLRPGPLTSGIDLKTGPGAYVLIPPSIHPDGTAYEWIGRDEGDLLEPILADLPIAPVESIEALREVSKTEVEGVEEGWDSIPEGMRNTTLASLAGNLRRQGASIESIAWSLAAVNKRLCDPPLPDSELVAIARSVARYEPEPDTEIEILGEGVDPDWPILSAKSLELPPPPEWLWHPYLPEGRLVLLDGSEGIGKGLFCANVATNLSGGTFGRSSDVLWLSAEDDPQEDILRRLFATGYDPAKNRDIHFLDLTPSFPQDIANLGAVLQQGDYRLVIMDPGRSYLGPPDGRKDFSYNNEADVRPGLEKLNRLAKAANVTIIFVHHWNKNTSADVADRAGGSKAFRQVVRHVMSMAFVGGTEDGRGALAVTKSNVGPTGHLLGYKIEAVDTLNGMELMTARWVKGQPQNEYRLEDWIANREAEQDNRQIEIVTTEFQEAAAALGLQPGDKLPSVKELAAADSPLAIGTRQEALDMIERWAKEGAISKGSGGMWFVNGGALLA